MKKLLILVLAIMLTSCGINGEQKLTINDSNQNVSISGESYNYVIVRLEYINQLIKLCEMFILNEDYENLEKANQARAKCVFDRLDNLKITFADFTNGIDNVCTNPPNNLTEQELLNLAEICQKL